MTKKNILVDYGPMSLNVGEDDLGGTGPRPQDCAPNDVVRFQAAVNERPRRSPHDDGEGNTLGSPFDLLARTQSDATPTPAEIGDAIEQLWIPEFESGLREVHVVMNAKLMPQTVLRIFEHDARLQIELNVSHKETRRLMAFNLHALCRHLGEKLQRDLCVSLHGDDESFARMRALWPEDMKP